VLLSRTREYATWLGIRAMFQLALGRKPTMLARVFICSIRSISILTSCKMSVKNSLIASDF
jgi:hypothetical protein